MGHFFISRLRFGLRYSKLFLITILIYILVSSLSCLRNSEQIRFQRQVHTYLKFFRENDFQYQSQHSVAPQLIDVSALHFQEYSKQLDAYFTKLSHQDTTRFDPTSQVEYTLLMRHLARQRLQYQEVQQWQHDVVYYGRLLGNLFYWPLQNEALTPTQKLDLLLKRLDELPRFIQQVRDNLVTVTITQIETALIQNKGIIEIINTDLTRLAQATSVFDDSLKRRLQFGVLQLEEWNTYLNKELLPHVSVNDRLGELVFEKMLQSHFGSETSRDEILNRLTAFGAEQKAQIVAAAKETNARYFPKRKFDPSDPYEVELLVTEAINFVNGQLVEISQVPAEIKNIQAEGERFIQLKSVLTLKKKSAIEILPLPAPERGFELMTTTIMGPQSPKFYCFFNPGRSDWKWPLSTDFLRYFNRGMLKVQALSLLVPGQYLQMVYADSIATPMQFYFGDLAYQEGWKLYAPYLMRKAGFTGYDPMFILMQDLNLFQTALSAQLGIRFHTQNMSKTEVLAELKRQGYVAEAIQEFYWRQIYFQPEVAIARCLGFFQLRELYQQVRRSEMNSFSGYEFYNKLLNSGVVPIQFIRQSFLRRK